MQEEDLKTSRMIKIFSSVQTDSNFQIKLPALIERKHFRKPVLSVIVAKYFSTILFGTDHIEIPQLGQRWGR